MPTQPTCPPPRAMAGAEGLRRAPSSLYLVKSVTVEVARDHEDGGARAFSLRRVLTLFRRCRLALEAWRQRRRLQVDLRSLSPRELQDIGVTSAEIDHIAARRAIDRLRDGTAYPGMH